MTQYSSIIVTGSIAYDEIMDFPGLFVNHLHKEKLHQINVSFAVDRLEKQLGGTATNIAYNLKLITKKYPIAVLSAVGRDGKNLLDFLKKNKIKTDGIFIDKNLYTATGRVISDVKDNQIWGYYYGASCKAKNINLDKYAKKNSLLVISANHQAGFLNFQRQAIKLKIPYFYDPGMSLTWIKDKDLECGVKDCRWLIGNDYEIAMILKRINKTIKKLTHLRQGYGGQSGLSVITTLGEEGVLYQSKKENYKVKAYKLKKVIDPTGAGDAWRGGFLAGIVEGKSIIESLKLGNALASFAIEKYGTVNHQPSKVAIEKRLKKIYSY